RAACDEPAHQPTPLPGAGTATTASAEPGSGKSRKVDDAADPVLGFHQLEAAVDVVERQLVRDEGVDVDLAREIAVDELRHLVAALDAAERGAGDAPAGDQETRHDLERLALAGDAADSCEPPAHTRRLDRLPHHLHVAGRLERVVGAEASGQVEDLLHSLG